MLTVEQAQWTTPLKTTVPLKTLWKTFFLIFFLNIFTSSLIQLLHLSGATDCTRLRPAATVALCDFFIRNPELLCDCDICNVNNKVVESCKVPFTSSLRSMAYGLRSVFSLVALREANAKLILTEFNCSNALGECVLAMWNSSAINFEKGK